MNKKIICKWCGDFISCYKGSNTPKKSAIVKRRTGDIDIGCWDLWLQKGIVIKNIK